MKDLKTGYDQTDFYLVAFHEDELLNTTKTQNILFEDRPFQIESDEAIDRIEVWNYKQRSKAGSILIKGPLKSKKYTYEFKKSNLFIEVSAVNSQLSEEARLRKIKRGISNSSTLLGSSE